MSLEFTGNYNPIKGQEYRTAFAIGGGIGSMVVGDNATLDAHLDILEQGGGYTWTETSTTVQELGAMSPDELQSKVVTYDDFCELVNPHYAGRLLGDLRGTGARTYADLFALGSQAITERSGIAHRSRRIGAGGLGYIRAAAFRQTGRRLPFHLAAPDELTLHYKDIKKASVALALPHEAIQIPEQIRGIHVETLGDLVQRFGTTNSGRYALLGRLAAAAQTNIIAPFYAARG